MTDDMTTMIQALTFLMPDHDHRPSDCSPEAGPVILARKLGHALHRDGQNFGDGDFASKRCTVSWADLSNDEQVAIAVGWAREVIAEHTRVPR